MLSSLFQFSRPFLFLYFFYSMSGLRILHYRWQYSSVTSYSISFDFFLSYIYFDLLLSQFAVHIGPGPQTMTLALHRQIKAIISRHRRCFLRFGDLSILDPPMLEIFRRQSYNISNLRISHVPKPDYLVSFYLIYVYIYWVIFILFWFVLKEKTTLKM